ncbi:hypothetical protein AX15_005771 [Amanita polypyramis BW_CC]|nr:hypothetical protein AX15_005771 [Amanita polypyramis BW_CC]
MKLNSLFILAFGAAFASVEAAPLRMLVVTNNQGISQNMRFGHAVPNTNMNSGQTGPVERFTAGPDAQIRRPCIMRKMHNKALQMYNTFRTALGLPPIDGPKLSVHREHGKDVSSGPTLRILPFIGTEPTFVEIKGSNGEIMATTRGGEPLRVVGADGQPLHGHHPHHDPHHPDHHHEPHHHHKHKTHNFRICRNAPFLKRLSFALMTLGPWEGRVMAFVLGCGIGVLMRMFWVLTVIIFRAVKGRKSKEIEYTIIHEYIDDGELATVPPPTYTRVDEKLGVKKDQEDSSA